MDLTKSQRRHLVREAHALHPVVMVGREGPTSGVLDAVDTALAHHDLIKVRFQSFKDERREIANDLTDALGASLVRLIGHVAILYRQNEDPEKRKIALPSS